MTMLDRHKKMEMVNSIKQKADRLRGTIQES